MVMTAMQMQMQLQVGSIDMARAASLRSQRNSPAKPPVVRHANRGTVAGTEAWARRKVAKSPVASGHTARFGIIRARPSGCLARWPTSLHGCIGCFAAHARGGRRNPGLLAKPGSRTAAVVSSIQPPLSSSTKARPNACSGGRGLTSRSRRGPTAGRACPAWATSVIVPVRACPARCRPRLTSNVRPHANTSRTTRMAGRKM
jgi:hypothetical protein